MNELKLIKFAKQHKDRIKDKHGYILVYCPSNPFSKHGYTMEHRLVVEEKINRLLTKDEVIHHINSVKDDNRIENLMLFKNQKAHASFHRKIRQFGLTKHILREAENRWEKVN